MKQDVPGIRFLTVLVCLGVLVYFGMQIYGYVTDPLKTVQAYSYQAEVSISVSGWVIRDEQLLEGDDGGGLLQITRGEGERVSAGGTVAAVYADQETLDRQNQIEALQEQIEQYEYAQDVEQGSEAIVKLDSQIRSHMLTMEGFLTADKLDDASDTCIQELRSLILKRDYTYTGTEDAASVLAELQAQLQTLQAQSAASVRWVTAPEAGLYSGVVDGYETLLTPENLDTLTPASLSTLQPLDTTYARLGKLVLGDAWYYAAVVPEVELDRLETGDRVTLRFAKGIDQDLQVQVYSTGSPVDGEAVVIFRGTTYLQQMTLLRQQNADVILKTYTGIRVPRSALHVETEEQEEEDGTIRQTQKTVVYCLVSRTVRSKPVEVIYNGDGYVLVAGTSDVEIRRLRDGETVVVEGHGLRDGLNVDMQA